MPSLIETLIIASLIYLGAFVIGKFIADEFDDKRLLAILVMPFVLPAVIVGNLRAGESVITKRDLSELYDIIATGKI